MKQIIKKSLSPALHYLFRPFPKKGATILAYHQVIPHIIKEALSSPSEYITTNLFEKHLKWLKQRYVILPLRDLLEYHKQGITLHNTIAITFDDGWENTYTEAFPLLKKYQIPVTVFLTTDYIGSKNPIWFSSINRIIEECSLFPSTIRVLVEQMSSQHLPDDIKNEINKAFVSLNASRIITLLKTVDSRTAERVTDEWAQICKMFNTQFINTDDWLDWEQIYEMEKSGLVEFGPHGERHYFFTTINNETINKEIIKSWETLHSHLNKTVKCFCFPGGLYQVHHLELLRKTTIEFATTFSGGKVTKNTSCFQLPRNGVNWKSCSNEYDLYNLVECVPGFYRTYPVR